MVAIVFHSQTNNFSQLLIDVECTYVCMYVRKAMVPTRGNITHAYTLHAGVATPARMLAIENGACRQ